MRQTKQQYVYDYIKTKINNNEYTPGILLTEELICSELNVSRTPVREAIRRLTSEELLVMTPGVGLSIPTIGLEDLIEVYDMREVLEGLAVKLFIERAAPASIKHLQEIMEKQEQAVKKEDVNAFMKYDMEFHRSIDAVVGNKRLTSSLDTIYGQINRLAYINKEDPAISSLGISGHETIMKHIINGEKEEAVYAMEEHIRSVKKYYLSKYFNL